MKNFFKHFIFFENDRVLTNESVKNYKRNLLKLSKFIPTKKKIHELSLPGQIIGRIPAGVSEKR